MSVSRPLAAPGRRTISVSLLVVGTIALVTGTLSLLLPRGSFVVPAHVATGCLVGLLSVLHLRLNRTPIGRYLRDLGWPPVLVRVAVAVAIAAIALVPVLRLIRAGLPA